MTKETMFEITKSVIAISIVVGAIASIFIAGLSDAGIRVIQSLATLVIGYYFGAQTTPLSGIKAAFGSKSPKKNK